MDLSLSDGALELLGVGAEGGFDDKIGSGNTDRNETFFFLEGAEEGANFFVEAIEVTGLKLGVGWSASTSSQSDLEMLGTLIAFDFASEDES